MTIIASGDQIAALKDGADAQWLGQGNFVALELDDELRDEHVEGSGIVVVHVDPKVPSSMRRIEQLRRSHPNLPQIVALEAADLALVRTLVRQGVADVVALPLSADELLQVAVAVLEVRNAEISARVKQAPLIAITRSPSASGNTTLATHLAARLASNGLRVCLLDLDIQAGRALNLLGLESRRSLSDLLEAGARIDAEVLKSVAVVHSSGAAIVGAPLDILPLESLEATQLHKVFGLARQMYDVVLIDLPANLTNWSLSALAQASGVLMLVEQNLESLRQAKRRLDLFRRVGLDSTVISVVVNRVEKRLFGAISLSDVEEALQHKVLAGLAADNQNLILAQDQGLLVQELRKKSPYAQDIEKLVNELQARFDLGDRL